MEITTAKREDLREIPELQRTAFTKEASNTPASDNYPYTLEDMSVVYDNVDENGNY